MGKQIEVILTKDVTGLGRFGDVKAVRAGYAANFLVPKDFAIFNTPENANVFKDFRKKQDKKRIQLKADAQALLANVNNKTVTLKQRVNDDGQLYGSVSITDVIKLVSAQLNVMLEKTHISIGTGIKSVGDHTVQVNLFDGVAGSFTVTVESEDAEESDA